MSSNKRMDVPAGLDLGPHLTPVSIRHPGLGLTWTVLAVLENWTTFAVPRLGRYAAETKRFRVRVSGPLPGDPSAVGEFVMVIPR